MAPRISQTGKDRLSNSNSRLFNQPVFVDESFLQDSTDDLVDEDEQDAFPHLTNLFAFEDEDFYETDQTGMPVAPIQPSPLRHLLENLESNELNNQPNVADQLDNYDEIYYYEHKGATFKRGDGIESHSGTFLLIKRILRDRRLFSRKEIIIQGWLMKRSSHSFPVPFRKTNELTMCREKYRDDPRPAAEQGLTDFLPEDILQKRNIIVAKAPYPHFSCLPKYQKSKRLLSEAQKRHIRETEVLVCRCVFTQIFDASPFDSKSKRRKAKEGTIRYVTGVEADIETLCSRTGCICHDSIDALQLATGDITYGSSFCGCGGDICGAIRAGLKLKFANDNNHKAVHVCRSNNRNVEDVIKHMDNSELLLETTILGVNIHVYHASFPCQSFSPANKNANGPPDAARTPRWHLNADLILGTRAHLEKFRPMIHTQENTAGLIQRHSKYLWAPVSDMVELGYNVRWRIIQFQEYGLPASRSRLVLLAARHDIPLPEFPKSTHSKTGITGTRPFVTVAEALSTFNGSDPVHRAEARELRLATPKENWIPYDPQQKTLPCIMASSQDSRPGKPANIHYSGRRKWTLKELAHFQSFPQNYKFDYESKKKDVETQIGNAVPPMIWKMIMEEIVKSLRAHGRKLLSDEASASIPNMSNDEIVRLSERMRRSVTVTADSPSTESQDSSPATPRTCGSSPSTPILLDDFEDAENFVIPTPSRLPFKPSPTRRRNVKQNVVNNTPTKRKRDDRAKPTTSS